MLWVKGGSLRRKPQSSASTPNSRLGIPLSSAFHMCSISGVQPPSAAHTSPSAQCSVVKQGARRLSLRKASMEKHSPAAGSKAPKKPKKKLAPKSSRQKKSLACARQSLPAGESGRSRRHAVFLGHCERAMLSLHGGELPHRTCEAHGPHSEKRPRSSNMRPSPGCVGGNTEPEKRATPIASICMRMPGIEPAVCSDEVRRHGTSDADGAHRSGP
jgi:hypothetical protein